MAGFGTLNSWALQAELSEDEGHHHADSGEDEDEEDDRGHRALLVQAPFPFNGQHENNNLWGSDHRNVGVE